MWQKNVNLTLLHLASRENQLKNGFKVVGLFRKDFWYFNPRFVTLWGSSLLGRVRR